MAEAKQDLQGYLKGLKEKQAILDHLISNYDDGKSKGFYCLAVNLLPLYTLREVIKKLTSSTDLAQMSVKDKARKASGMFREKASELQIELRLRK